MSSIAVSFEFFKYPEGPLWIFCSTPGCLSTQLGNHGVKEPIRDYSGSNQRAAEFSPAEWKRGNYLYPISQLYCSGLRRKSSRYLSILCCGCLQNMNKARNNGGWLGGLGSSSRFATGEVQHRGHNLLFPKSLPALSNYESNLEFPPKKPVFNALDFKSAS